MTGDAQVLLWIAGVHLLGLACIAVLLFPALKDENAPGTVRRSDGESDEGWGHGPKRPPAPRLDPEDAAWAAELTRAWREPAPAGPGS